MSRIETLTDAQIVRFPEFVDQWTRIGLCTDPAEQPRATLFDENLIEDYP